MAEERWIVRLPPGVRPPYTVFLNGVRQEPGADFEPGDGVLRFARPLQREGRIVLCDDGVALDVLAGGQVLLPDVPLEDVRLRLGGTAPRRR